MDKFWSKLCVYILATQTPNTVFLTCKVTIVDTLAYDEIFLLALTTSLVDQLMKGKHARPGHSRKYNTEGITILVNRVTYISLEVYDFSDSFSRTLV